MGIMPIGVGAGDELEQAPNMAPVAASSASVRRTPRAATRGSIDSFDMVRRPRADPGCRIRSSWNSVNG